MLSSQRTVIPKSVLAHWKLSEFVTELGSGKINDTYRVGDETVVQRINSTVFSIPGNLVENYRRVLPHICDLVPDILQTEDGEDSVTDAEGNVWRAFRYYDARSFKSLPDSLCRTAGQAYGRLLERLKDCNDELRLSIAGFHILSTYVEELGSLRSRDPRLPECAYVDEALKEISSIGEPTQIIHGDCKIGNLLFDPEFPRVLKIVDLDTLMHGSPSWDFGDLVRSVLSGIELHVTSDQQLLRRIGKLCRGFFEEYRLADSQAVIQFAHAPAYMSFMLGIRYLTDHLAGDRYFKVKQRGENLSRARQQFSLHERLSSIRTEIAKLIESVIATRPSQ